MSLEGNSATSEGPAISNFGDIHNMSFVSFVGNYVPCNTGEIRENIDVEVSAKTSTNLVFFRLINPSNRSNLLSSTRCRSCDPPPSYGIFPQNASMLKKELAS